jgi:hypothetical protein
MSYQVTLVISCLNGTMPLRLLRAGEVQALDHLLHSATAFTALCQPTPLSPLPVTIWYQTARVRPPCLLRQAQAQGRKQ